MTTEVGALKTVMEIDSVDFTKGIEAINRKIRSIESEFKVASSGVTRFEGSLEQLKDKSSIISNKLELQSKKVEELKHRYDALSTSQNASSADIDKATTAYNRAVVAMKKTELELEKINSKIQEQSGRWNNLRNNLHDVGTRFQDVGSNMQSAGSDIASSFGVATAAVGAGLGLAVKSAADFEAQLSNIKAVSGASSGEMNQLKDVAVDLGAKTKYSSLEAAQGIEELIKAGVGVKDIVHGGLEGALSLATAGELELAEAAEIASTALNSFKADGLSVKNAADILAGAANASATSVGELKLGLSQVSAVASGVGLSFKDTSTTLALFSNNGLKGSDAGTSLKTMLMNLQPATDKQTKLFERLGIVTKDGSNQFFDAHGKIKSMTDIAGVLQGALKGMTDQQRQAALETMFGSDAIRAGNILYKEGADGLKKMYSEMSKVTSAQVAAEKMNNFKGKVEELKGSLETAGISVGNALLPAISKIVTAVQSVSNAFNNLSPTTQKFIAIGGAIATVLLGIITAFGVVLAVVGSAVSGFGALSLALAEGGVLAGAFSSAIAVITGPIGITVAAVTGLIAILTALYKNNETFKDGVNQIWQEISNKFNEALTFIQSKVSAVMTEVKSFFQEVLTKIKGFWNENGSAIIAIVKLAMDNIKSYIEMVMGIIKGIFEVVWPIISNIIKVAWEGIKLVVRNGIDLVLGIIQTVLKLLQGDWQGAWNTIKATAQSIWKNIEQFFKNVNLVQIGKDIIQGLIDGISSMANAVVKRAQDIANSIKNTIKDALDINSPSRVMADEIGRWIPEGLAMGITKNLNVVVSASEKMANVTTGNTSGNIVSTLGTTKETVNHYNFHSGAVAINAKDLKEVKDITDLFNRLTQTARAMGVR